MIKYSRASEKFSEAVSALVGSSPIQKRLFSAFYNLRLQPDEMPPNLRNDFEALMTKLEEHRTNEETIDLNDVDAARCAHDILEMYQKVENAYQDEVRR